MAVSGRGIAVQRRGGHGGGACAQLKSKWGWRDGGYSVGEEVVEEEL